MHRTIVHPDPAGGRSPATPPSFEEEIAEAVDTLVDALCHFAGEAPDLDVLRRCLGARAVVAEADELGCDTETWLARLVVRASARRAEGLGHFVEIVARELIAPDEDLFCVVLEVRVSDTSEGRVVRTELVPMEIVLRRGRVGLEATRLTLGRTNVAP